MNILKAKATKWKPDKSFEDLMRAVVKVKPEQKPAKRKKK
jgi:hypothetical protein